MLKYAQAMGPFASEEFESALTFVARLAPSPPAPPRCLPLTPPLARRRGVTAVTGWLAHSGRCSVDKSRHNPVVCGLTDGGMTVVPTEHMRDAATFAAVVDGDTIETNKGTVRIIGPRTG